MDSHDILHQIGLILGISVRTDDLDKCFDERKLAKILNSPRLSPKSAMKQRIVGHNKDLTCLIKSNVQLGINECTFEGIALISSLTHESLSEFIQIVNNRQEVEVQKLYPHMLVYQTNIELYVDGELLCRPNNFGEGVLLTLGAYYMFDFEFDKAFRKSLHILTTMLTWNKGHIPRCVEKLLDDIHW